MERIWGNSTLACVVSVYSTRYCRAAIPSFGETEVSRRRTAADGETEASRRTHFKRLYAMASEWLQGRIGLDQRINCILKGLGLLLVYISLVSQGEHGKPVGRNPFGGRTVHLRVLAYCRHADQSCRCSTWFCVCHLEVPG